MGSVYSLRPIPGPPRPSRTGFLLTRISAALGIRIPPLPLVMPDHRWEIQPDDSVLRTMLLGLGFVSKRLERKRGNDQREADDETGNQSGKYFGGLHNTLPVR
jgi:hypothetical protein